MIKRLLAQGFLLVFLLAVALTALAAKVDINAAAAEDIAAALKGVGEKQAQAIVDYRETNGPFKSLDDLAKVKGVGAKTLDNNKDNISFGKSTKAATSTAAEDSTKTMSETETTSTAVGSGAIDINSASADDIAAALKGVGEKQAQAIVDYRKTNGPFKSLDDLAKVKGVGAKTLANNKSNIQFGQADKTQTAKADSQSIPNKPKQSAEMATGPVDVNSASAQEIAAGLNGVGEKQADAIVAFRTDNGPFESIDDLGKVKGIGVKTIAKNIDNISLGTSKPKASSSSEKTTSTDSKESSDGNSGTKMAKAKLDGPVNINQASVEELMALKNIGPVKAAAIVSYRNENGAFKSADDLLQVKGIGEITLEANRDYIELR